MVLTIAGFAPALLRDRDKGAENNPADLYFGTEANWWVGLALVAVSAVFITCALLRPVEVEEPLPSESGPEPASQSGLEFGLQRTFLAAERDVAAAIATSATMIATALKPLTVMCSPSTTAPSTTATTGSSTNIVGTDV